jgi:hypothetical protein
LYDLSQYTQSIEQRKRKKYICIRVMTISYTHNRLFILYVDYAYAQGPRKQKRDVCTPLLPINENFGIFCYENRQ